MDEEFEEDLSMEMSAEIKLDLDKNDININSERESIANAFITHIPQNKHYVDPFQPKIISDPNNPMNARIMFLSKHKVSNVNKKLKLPIIYKSKGDGYNLQREKLNKSAKLNRLDCIIDNVEKEYESDDFESIASSTRDLYSQVTFEDEIEETLENAGKCQDSKKFYGDFKNIRDMTFNISAVKARILRRGANNYSTSVPISPPGMSGGKLERMKQVKKVTNQDSFIGKYKKNFLTPQRLGIIRMGGPQHLKEINCESYSMGDKYAQAFGTGISILDQTRAINLRNNRLSNKGTLSILENMPTGVKKLNLAGNQFGIPGYKKLGKIIRNYEMNLRELSIEGVSGGDTGAQLLCKSIPFSPDLRFLNISKNQLSDKGAGYLSVLLKQTTKLNVLFLHWNMIKSKGANDLATAIKLNEILQVFDASFNSFGQGGSEGAKAFAVMFKKNATLLHLDLSHNHFKEKDCGVLALGLEQNHTILGIHMLGNEAATDEKGFIVKGKHDKPSVSHLFCRMPENLETGQRRHKIMSKLEVFSHCWICEGWTQVSFRITKDQIPQHLHKKRLPVFVCMSFEKYKPDLMELNPETEVYTLVRMVPPGKLKFCYLAQNDIFTTPERQTFPLKKASKTAISAYLGYEGVAITGTNIIDNLIQRRELLNEDNVRDLGCYPRPELKNLPDREKTPWHIGISVFKTYIPDNEVLLGKCFEKDWESSKLQKVIKDEEEQMKVKDILRKYYRFIRNIYKYFAAVEPCNGVFSIGSNVFSEICNQMDIVDNMTLRQSDVDLDFVTANAGTVKKVKNNPERALVRYQLMEVFVRLAIRKWTNNPGGENLSISNAVQKLMKEFVIISFNHCDPHSWRKRYLWNEECDLIYKKHYENLKIIYSGYLGKNNLPGEKTMMCLDEFITMLADYGITDAMLTSRDINMAFGQSIMTSIGEFDGNKHLQLNFIEFIETLGRAAHKINIGGRKLSDDKLHPKLKFMLEKMIATMKLMGKKKPVAKKEAPTEKSK